MATPKKVKKTPAKKTAPPPRNMGLGKLKGVTNGKERKRRLDAAIEANGG